VKKMVNLVFGKVDDVGHELGEYVVITQEIPWSLVKDRIGGKCVSVSMVNSLEKEYLESICNSLPARIDAIIGIGGGVAIDAAKYCAWKRDCNLVLVPTILSVDAYVSSVIAVRENGKIKYTGKVSPSMVIIDYKSIQSAPKRFNIAGTGDILSCKTAVFDWKLSHEITKEPYDQEVAFESLKLVNELIEYAPEIRDVTIKGIKTIVDLHTKANLLIEKVGNSRPEEGSEHIFYYTLEYLTKRNYLHGEVVATGIYISSYLQSNEEKEIADIMNKLNLEYRPHKYGVTKNEFINTLLLMKQYSSSERFYFSILNLKEITKEEAEKLWNQLISIE
jgi:glycerol-1-phosphate dehydrogenase [NAD(P)+]